MVSQTLPDGTVIRGSFKAELRKHEGEWVIHIHTLTAIDHGGGKLALQAIMKVADEYSIAIRLEPVSYRTTLTPEVRDTQWLTSYYERYGFQTNGKWMLRHPVDSSQQ
jgi:hypothetical protein